MHNNVIENIPKMTDTKNNSNVVKGNLDRTLASSLFIGRQLLIPA